MALTWANTVVKRGLFGRQLIAENFGWLLVRFLTLRTVLRNIRSR